MTSYYFKAIKGYSKLVQTPPNCWVLHWAFRTSIYLLIYVTVCLFNYLSVCSSSYMSFCSSSYLSVCSSSNLSLCSSSNLSLFVYLSVCLFVRLSFCLLFKFLFLLSVCLAICLFIVLSVCLFINFCSRCLSVQLMTFSQYFDVRENRGKNIAQLWLSFTVKTFLTSFFSSPIFASCVFLSNWNGKTREEEPFMSTNN